MDNKSVRIVRLDIDEMDDFSGVDAIALVEEPAIESNFIYFSKQEQNKEIFESYSDYPDAVSNNAKKGIELNEKVNNKCATQVGKVRAQQLAKKEPISVETIKRMYSYLSRAEEYYDENDTEACGTISYLLWGGLAAKRWSEAKLKELGLFEGNVDISPFRAEDYDVDVSALPDYVNEPSGSVIPKDIFVTPRAGETEDEFISRCIPVVIGEGKDQDQAAAICYSYWREGFEDEKENTDIQGVLEHYVSELFDFLGYADGLPIYSTKEEAQEVAQIAGCGYTYHEHQVGEFLVYMPCESHGEIDEQVIQEAHDEWMKSRLVDGNDLTIDELEGIMDYLDSVAIDVEFSQETFAGVTGGKQRRNVGDSISFLDTPTTKIRYRYAVNPAAPANKSGNSRGFCKAMMAKPNVVYRKEDINNASLAGANPGFGPNGSNQYNLFLYRGGNNCRHIWETVTFTLQNGKWVDSTKSVGSIANLIKPRDPQTPLTDVIGPLGINLSKQKFEDQQILVGAAMIPDKLIYRFDESGEFWVYFSKETIKKIAYKWMERKYTDSTNLEHESYSPLEDTYVVESWLVTDPSRDKSKIYMGEEMPEGTWMVAMKIKNKEVWNEYVKTGKVKGFSVEGFFVDEMLNRKTKE